MFSKIWKFKYAPDSLSNIFCDPQSSSASGKSCFNHIIYILETKQSKTSKQKALKTSKQTKNPHQNQTTTKNLK